jgi:anti-sigma factor (TIGR02949 family)
MSEHNDVSCRHALEQLWALIDCECDPETSSELQAHLATCQRCYPHYDFQRAFRSFIADRCRHDAPPDLRRRVFMALLAEESAEG